MFLNKNILKNNRNYILHYFHPPVIPLTYEIHPCNIINGEYPLFPSMNANYYLVFKIFFIYKYIKIIFYFLKFIFLSY